MVRFLEAVRHDGTASFVGIERVTAGSGAVREFLLQDAGTLEGRARLAANGPSSPARVPLSSLVCTVRAGSSPSSARAHRSRWTTGSNDRGSGCWTSPAPDMVTGGPATLVLSARVMPGHEQAFEAVLHQLASEARAFPGHEGLTVMRPQPGGAAMYAVVAHFATGQDMDRWLSSDVRAKLVAEADRHSAGDSYRYLSGLEGWLAQPDSPVVLPVARWKIVVLSMAGIVPLLEAVSYLLVPHLAGVPG